MYRDLIEAPVKFEVNNHWWWYQRINDWDGDLKAVNLYDAEGDIVAEFSSMEEMEAFLKGVQ